MERTFIMIKPDGVQRKLISEVISRFELKGFTLLGLKLMSVSKELAEEHYNIHKERPFFKDLVEFICSSPVVAMVWEGEGVVTSSRKIIGATNPLEADSGTIRGDFGISVGRNLIHGSDAIITAETEINLWFDEKELVSWEPTLKSWLCE
ncbi:nucleoside-diphosphate kinase [Candidatus Atelocyanobacterium thalassae]|uniref:Nucleoside diphosphate kinase n=1 Tax=cyanobacterium endosymbiont of Braarudosphaera bigelowii TaxID=1285375 RepID=A0ABM7UCV3_9CHRO|nr:nucleoside-diphosphate kinase [Candidatus Atelocyanobacterium thalassa]BDA39426.1 nucleoside diphosphate kinase [cyanobacterium endosymbiont of Braarudosphaera bigelowii]